MTPHVKDSVRDGSAHLRPRAPSVGFAATSPACGGGAKSWLLPCRVDDGGGGPRPAEGVVEGAPVFQKLLAQTSPPAAPGWPLGLRVPPAMILQPLVGR